MQIRDWLQETTAEQIMVRKVLTVRPDVTLAEAAAVFVRASVSAVPVVSEDGVCQGVFSVIDIVRAEEKVAGAQQELAHSSYFSSELALPASVYAEKLQELRDKLVPAAMRPVQEFMTTDLVSVQKDTPLARIIMNMVDAHVHRLLVMDDSRRLCGIISTMDVLAALVREARLAV
jgi:CBS domain-containing protein